MTASGARAIACAVTFVVLPACSGPADPYYQGYVEGEFVRVASPFAGTLTALNVQRGAAVAAGAPLFALEQDAEAAALREAQERVREARARVADLRKARREPEQDAARAQLEQARAGLRLSQASFARQEKLVAQGFVSGESLDAARTALERDRARVAELDAALRLTKLPARPDAIRAAEAEAEAARAEFAQARWRLEQKSVAAGVSGVVIDTLFVNGEWVPAGAPVVSILPPGNVKLRFFVPETHLGALRLGQRVTVRCDGCGAPIEASVSFVSPQAEYTPPVIYSRDTRAKLVFLVEARPDLNAAMRLHPGQPVEVHLGRS